jgi:glycosyltransferase involved in cell wall biosynthesis
MGEAYGVNEPLICHLCDYCAEVSGSFVDALLSIARYCKEELHIETICLFPYETRERSWIKRFCENKILVDFVPRKRNIIVHAARILKNYHPLIFHSHFVLFDLSAIMLKLFYYRSSKVIWHLHNAGPLGYDLRQKVSDLIKIKLLGQYLGDLFIAVGDGILDDVIAHGFPKQRTRLLHNSIDVKRFSRNHKIRKEVRKSFGAKDDDIIFLLLGWEPFRKGVDIFVKAATQYNNTYDKRAFFTIIGTDYTKKFVSQLFDVSKSGFIIHVIDPLEDFPSVLNGIDVFVSASRGEGLPYAVLEAMAAGKLILSSELPGVRQSYGRSAGVWLFPTEDSTALCGLINKAMELSIADRKSLGHKNYQYVREFHSIDIWTENLARIYLDLLEQRDGHSICSIVHRS